MVDVDDLVTLPSSCSARTPRSQRAYRERWTDVFVDEYQDVDEQQYLMLRQLAAPGARICAIGDPDQAIYGFRGGDVGYFLRFARGLRRLRGDADSGAGAAPPRCGLSRSYRSAPTIVRAAMQLIRPGTLVPGRELIPARTDIPDGPVVLHAVADEREEAEAIAAEIEKLLGGASFHALDSRAVDGRDRAEHQLSFADFAVLYRTSAQAAAIGEALARRGFPFQRRAHSRLAECRASRRSWPPSPPCHLASALAAAPTPLGCSCDSRLAARRGHPARCAAGRSTCRRARCWRGSGARRMRARETASGPRPWRRSGPPPTCSARWRRAAAPTWTGSSTSSRSGPRSTPGTRGPTGSRC